jgi:aspartate racemase
MKTNDATEDALRKRLSALSPSRRALIEETVSKGFKKSAAAEAPESGKAPLTPNQSALWYLSRLDPDGFSLNAPLALRIHGTLDKNALERALSEIVRRHVPLRSVFLDDDNETYQKAIDRPRIEIEEDSATSHDHLTEVAREFARRAFNLSTGPLVRFKLIRLGPDDHMLLSVAHHIATDGWSKAVLSSELKTLYAAFVSGKGSPLGEHGFSYYDYARNFTNNAQDDISYWVQKLSAAPGTPALSIPADRPRPQKKRSLGSHLVFNLDADLARKVKDTASKAGATLYMALLSAFAALMYSRTGSTDVVVGTPFAGRSRPETEGLIGYFINTLPMRMDLTGNPTFVEILHRARETALEAIEHQDAPLVKIVEALNPRRSVESGPLFQTLFQLRNMPGPERNGDGEGVEITEEPLDFGISQFDMTLEAVETAQGITCSIIYDADLYVEETARGIAGDFSAILERAALEPECRLSDFRFESELESLIRGVFADELEIEGVSSDDDLFALGASSLTALRIAARLSETLGKEIRISTIFDAPTPARLAVALAWDKTNSTPIKRLADGATAPLLSAQFGIWYQCALDPGTTAYNTPFEVRMKGDLDYESLAESFFEFVRRHEALRTVFMSEDGAPRQRALPPESTRPTFEISDLSALDPEERRIKSRELAINDSSTSFDVARWPLFKARLKKLESDLHILSVTIHHIIFDGWSKEILIRELGEIYSAIRGGRAPDLPRLFVNCRDFAARAAANEDGLEREAIYWKQKLSGELPVLALPLDKERPAAFSHNPSRVRTVINGELRDALVKVGLRGNATLYATLLSAFYVLLGRYTGEDDVIIASTFAGRARPEAQKLFGLFMNSLPLRANLSQDPRFIDFLAVVRATALEAIENQAIGMENIVKHLNVSRDASQNPLLKIVFQLSEASRRRFVANGIVIDEADPVPAVGLSDLFLNVTDKDGRLVCDFDYSADLFDARTIQRISLHYMTILEDVVKDPGARLSKLRMLTDSELDMMLVDWNRTETRYPNGKSVKELFEETARARPDAVAIEDGPGSVTYAELNALSDNVAGRLGALGVRPGSVVAIEAARSLNLMVAIVGAVKAGAVYAAIDPELPPRRREYMIKDSGAATLLATGADNAIDIRTLSGSSAGLAEVFAGDDIDAPFSVNYTSGSTGAPKGAISTNRNILRLVTGTNNLEFSPLDLIGQCRSLSTDVLNFEIWGAFLNGARLVIIDHETLITPLALGKFIRERGITVMEVSSSLFNHAVKYDPSAFKPLRYLGIGGESADPRFVKAALDRGKPEHFVNSYGPTECGVYSTYYTITDADRDAIRIPIGRPISGDRVYILDRHMNPVPIGVAGEIWLGGDGVGLGYLNKPELTAERFLKDPFSGDPGARIYRTGDVGRFLPDGNIDFLGRRDHQIKILGHRIELGEIEAVLNSHESVAESLVTAINGPEGEAGLAAYVVPAHGSALDEASLRRQVIENLPAYMMPGHFIALEKLPIAPGKKLDRNALPVPEPGKRMAPGPLSAPQSKLETRLVRIWEETLGIKPIGIGDNFFELGGHSLMAVRLFSRMEKELGLKLPLALFYRAPTIKELAANVERNDRSSDWRPLVQIRPAGHKPPLFCVHPGGGNVLCYSDLARHMDASRPLYGLQAVGLDGIKTPLNDVSEMADLYIEELRSIRPHGPYHIGGLCMGAIIAFEMARKLEAAGEKVGLVAAFDLWLAQDLDSWMEKEPGAPSAIKYYWHGIMFQLKRGQLAKAVMRRLKADSKRLLRSLNLSAVESKEILRVVEALLDARRAYVPKPYNVEITYFKTSGNRVNAAWRELATGGVEEIELSGDHAGILYEPYVKDLARILGNKLDETDTK